GNKDLNLFRLYHLVKRFGGYNRVTSQLKWRIVHSKLGLPATSSTTKLKSAYQRYLLPFEEFDKKLGSSFTTGIGGGLRGRSSMSASASGSAAASAGASAGSASGAGAASSGMASQHLAGAPGSSSGSSGRNFLSAREKRQSGLTPVKRPRVQAAAAKANKEAKAAKEAGKDKDAASVSAESNSTVASSSTAAATATANPAAADCASSTSTATAAGLLDDQAPPSLSRSSSVFERVEAPSNASDVAAAANAANKLADAVESKDNDDEGNSSAGSGAGDAYQVDDKVRVRYGEPGRYKVYDGRIVKRSWRANRVSYHVHYFGWNQRYDEIVTPDRILGRCHRGHAVGRLNHGQPLSSLPPPP
uniref:ARID domain-containing protein n=2 Tax=Macrostomum lignano TaxID=282301 RepID=A0A1I8HHI1_9PLAT